MKISNQTLSLLKNYSTIQKGILIEPGNYLKTRTKAVYAEAKIEEEFPVEVGIYDLTNLLSVIGLFNDPQFEFEENSVKISENDGSAETFYAYAGSGLVALSTNRKALNPPQEFIEFSLSDEQWTKVAKAIGVFQKPEVKLVSDGEVLKIATENHKNPQGNGYSMILDGNTHGYKCHAIFSIENMRLLKGSYTGMITKNYTEFKCTSGYDLTYIIGQEPSSSFK